MWDKDTVFFATEDKSVAVLIDAGSSKHPVQDVPQQTTPITKETACEKISQTIDNHIEKSRTKMLVIGTHGDIDHYNWLKNVLEKAKKIDPKNTLFIFGGPKKDYTAKLPKILEDPNLFNNASSGLEIRRSGFPDPTKHLAALATLTLWRSGLLL